MAHSISVRDLVLNFGSVQVLKDALNPEKASAKRDSRDQPASQPKAGT